MGKEFQILVIAVGLSISLSAVSLITVLQAELPEEDSIQSLVESESQENSRIGNPLYTGTGVSYTVETKETTVFVSGDANANWDMHNQVPRLEPDIALMSTGGVYSMDPELAAWSTSVIEPSKVFGYRYSDEENLEDFDKHMADYDSSIETLEFESGEKQEIENLNLTYLGHGTVHIETLDGKIMVDPWIDDSTFSPVSLRHSHEEWPETDIVLLTSGQMDSYSQSDIDVLQEQFGSTVVAEYPLAAHIVNKERENTVGVDKGGTVNRDTLEQLGATGGVERISEDLNIHVHSADHSSTPPTALEVAYNQADIEDLY